MEIMQVPFEKALSLDINGKKVEVFAFKTEEHGNIKLGVKAPRNVSVNREEIFEMKKANHQLKKERSA